MRPTKQQLDEALRETLASMVPDVDHVVARDVWEEMNDVREARGWSRLDRMKNPLRASGGVLFVCGCDTSINLNTATATVTVTVTMGMAIGTALVVGAIERKDPHDCHGEVITYRGGKYRLERVEP